MKPFFCYPHFSNDEYLKYLEKMEKKFSVLSIGSAVIKPEQAAKLNERAVIARENILRRVYRGEYYTDSKDIPRLTVKVLEQKELIWFWGEEDQVVRLINGQSDNFDNLSIGTVSVLDASAEFGAGVAEMCRSGSTSPVKIIPSAIDRILDFLTGRSTKKLLDFHTLCLVPRTRTGTDNIRAGKSVNFLHREVLRSRFWGIAPWYVMQGNVIECLEYREINRDIEAVKNSLADNVFYFSSETDANYFSSLVQLNFSGLDATVNIVGDAASSDYSPTFRLRNSLPKELIRYNHLFFDLVSSDGNKAYTDVLDLVSILPEHIDAAVSVVAVDLTTAASLPLQYLLNKLEFNFLSIIPAKKNKFNDSTTSGLWVKTHPGYQVVPPHYSARTEMNKYEASIYKQVNYFLNRTGGIYS